MATASRELLIHAGSREPGPRHGSLAQVSKHAALFPFEVQGQCLVLEDTSGPMRVVRQGDQTDLVELISS